MSDVRQCAVEVCEKRAYCRGWCRRHYSRWVRHGNPLYVTLPEDRFFRKVDKNGPIAANKPHLGRCWLWTGAKTHPGYGTFTVMRVHFQAHRWIYEHVIGPIPEGLVLDHFACDTPSCVNPTHVRPVSNRENILRGVGASAVNASRTHCPQGHPYDEANTYRNPSGQRFCKICAREATRRYKERKRQAA